MTYSQNQKIRNPKLFEYLKKLNNAFISVLDKSFFPEYGSRFDRIKTLIKGDLELVTNILELRPDLEERNLSLCLVSVEKCLKTLLQENICRNPPHASTVEEYQDELAFFLERLFKERERSRIRSLFANPEAFARHFDDVFLMEYLRYEKYLYDGSVSNFFICPLQNFICSRNIELEDRLAIKKITQEEFHRLVEAEESHGYELESYPEFILYMPVDGNDWREHIEGVITSLRLLKKEKIGFSRIYYAYALPSRPWKVIEPPAGVKFVEKQVEAFFNLTDSEEVQLKNLLILLNRIKEIGYLTASIRRFNFAYERERLEDSWIDYFISLESLYSKASELTEVTHRLATRISRVLGGNLLNDREELRNRIKEWYAIRSKIVHGVETKLSQEQLGSLEEILRKSIKWFINHEEYSNHDKIIDLIDLN
ncbi:MAG: hypothetical protein ABSB40_05035 [Nitrososphaeria archaeon]|jgi:hypothetical protein